MIYIGADHAGFELKEFVRMYFDKRGVVYEDCGTISAESVDYPLVAQKVCELIRQPQDKGILICGSGIGMSIAANRYRHIRAALCYDKCSAIMARKHNDANVLVLKGRNYESELTADILEAFMDTEFEGGRHERRVEQLGEIESKMF